MLFSESNLSDPQHKNQLPACLQVSAPGPSFFDGGHLLSQWSHLLRVFLHDRRRVRPLLNDRNLETEYPKNMNGEPYTKYLTLDNALDCDHDSGWLWRLLSSHFTRKNHGDGCSNLGISVPVAHHKLLPKHH